MFAPQGSSIASSHQLHSYTQTVADLLHCSGYHVFRSERAPCLLEIYVLAFVPQDSARRADTDATEICQASDYGIGNPNSQKSNLILLVQNAKRQNCQRYSLGCIASHIPETMPQKVSCRDEDNNQQSR